MGRLSDTRQSKERKKIGRMIALSDLIRIINLLDTHIKFYIHCRKKSKSKRQGEKVPPSGEKNDLIYSKLTLENLVSQTSIVAQTQQTAIDDDGARTL
jgi:hypothetical protein